MSSKGQIPGSGNPSYNQQPNYHANAQSPTMVHNSPFSHPPPYPLSGQQQSTLHVAASTHQNMMQPTTTTPTNAPDRQRLYRLTSTSEVEDDTHLNSTNEWQVIRRNKRGKNARHNSHRTDRLTGNTQSL